MDETAAARIDRTRVGFRPLGGRGVLRGVLRGVRRGTTVWRRGRAAGTHGLRPGLRQVSLCRGEWLLYESIQGLSSTRCSNPGEAGCRRGASGRTLPCNSYSDASPHSRPAPRIQHRGEAGRPRDPARVPTLGVDNVRTGLVEAAKLDAVVAELPEPLRNVAGFAYHTGRRSGEIQSLASRVVKLASKWTGRRAWIRVRVRASRFLWDGEMPEARFELARGCPRWILSPLRLPFRHSGRG